MPRVHTAKAAKDYPQHDIKKGDTYYHWSFFRGPKMMSKTFPRASQTTGSATLSAAYACSEEFGDQLDKCTTIDDIVSALDDAISAAEDVLSEFDDKISNLEDAFQGGCPALEEAQEQRDTFEQWKDELESAKSNIEAMDAGEYSAHDNFEGDFDDLSEEEQTAMLDAAREEITSDLSF